MVKQIVSRLVTELTARLRPRRVTVTLTAAALDKISKEGYQPTAGARPLRHLFQSEIEDRLTEDLLAGRLKMGSTVSIGVNHADQFKFVITPRTR